MAKFNSAWLVRKRHFRSPTGVTAETFPAMVERSRPPWQERVVDPKNRSGRPWGVGGREGDGLRKRQGIAGIIAPRFGAAALFVALGCLDPRSDRVAGPVGADERSKPSRGLCGARATG